ncbi:MAG: polyamine aminopropyltransferase [Candidatus Pacebacteria bacterium]|nr:polyamine aminopropyltransferase [Candidatus Paceibacterota bacterium]
MTSVQLGINMPRKHGVARILLGSSMFFTGASGLVSEYVLATVATYILGNSIEQMSITVALMMCAMGIGGWVQRFIKDNALIDKFILLETILALLIGFAPICIYAAFGLMEHHFYVVMYFFMIAIGMLVGFEIPLVMRINEKYVGALKDNASEIFGMDYIGAFVGALIWALFLLKTFPLTEISFLVAGSNFIVAIVTFGYFASKGSTVRTKTLFVLIMCLVALLLYGGLSNRAWSNKLEQRLYDDPIILAETTRYQRIVVTHYNKTDDYRLYINGNLQFSSVDEAIYHELLVHPVMNLAKSHQRVLILGGGDGLAVREVLKYPDVSSIHLVDLDPDMVRICRTHPALRALNGGAFDSAKITTSVPDISTKYLRRVMQDSPDSPRGEVIKERVARVEVINIDADLFLNSVKGLWDVVIIDFPDPSSVELTKLYSKQFYQKLRRLLAPGALVSIQATSPYHAKESYLCIRRTMEAARFSTLPYHQNVPSFGDWGWFLASTEKDSSVIRVQAENVAFDVDTRYITKDVFLSSMVFGKGSLTSKHKKINSLMEPNLLAFYRDESWLID